MIVFVLALVAIILGAIAAVRSQGQSLEAWGVIALGIALVFMGGVPNL